MLWEARSEKLLYTLYRMMKLVLFYCIDVSNYTMLVFLCSFFYSTSLFRFSIESFVFRDFICLDLCIVYCYEVTYTLHPSVRKFEEERELAIFLKFSATLFLTCLA